MLTCAARGRFDGWPVQRSISRLIRFSVDCRSAMDANDVDCPSTVIDITPEAIASSSASLRSLSVARVAMPAILRAAFSLCYTLRCSAVRLPICAIGTLALPRHARPSLTMPSPAKPVSR